MALDPPSDAQSAIAAWRDRAVKGRDDLRPLRTEALHLTLVFLGWQWAQDADRIASLIADSARGHEPPRLVPAGVRPVPPRGPRLFALELDDEHGACGALQAALVRALAGARLHEPEKRPFWPHITLARVKRGRRAAPLAAPGDAPRPFAAERLVLYRSTLRPQGAVYDPLWSTALA